MTTSAPITANQHSASLVTGPEKHRKANPRPHGTPPNTDSPELSPSSLTRTRTSPTSSSLAFAIELKPAGEHERFLVEQVAESAGASPAASASKPACDQRIAAKLLNGGGRAFATLQRYAAERSYHRAHTELQNRASCENKPN
jgi:hypothetical protein